MPDFGRTHFLVSQGSMTTQSNPEFTLYWQRNVKATLGIGILAGLIALASPVESNHEIFLGIIMGAFFSAVRLRLGAKAIERFASGASPKYMTGQHLLRYILFFGVLVLAFSCPAVNPWATLAGLLSGNIITICIAISDNIIHV